MMLVKSFNEILLVCEYVLKFSNIYCLFHSYNVDRIFILDVLLLVFVLSSFKCLFCFKLRANVIGLKLWFTSRGLRVKEHVNYNWC